MATSIDRKQDLSGGLQSATSWLLRKPNEIEDGYNFRLNAFIGAITRRLGYVQEGSSTGFPAITSVSMHEAKFKGGAKLFASANNSGATAMQLKWYQKSAGSTWTNLSFPYAVYPNSKLSMTDSVNEMYIAGKDNLGHRMTMVNVKETLATSTTRNLYGAPNASFITEYAGSLYAMNVEVNGITYPDRAYKSSGRLGAITFVQGSQTQVAGNVTVKVDSVQYLKPGMGIDFYRAGTETKTQDTAIIISVNKDQRTITFTGVTSSTNNASANAANDTINVGSSTAFPTGTPVVLSGGTVPTGLTAGTTYFAIVVDGTNIKLATTYANAMNGIAIDITAVGSGTGTVYMGYLDNDELWGAGRKNELAYYWNLDYPTTDKADFISILPGTTSDTEILAHAKSNNRLFLFTKNSVMRWDGSNPVTIFDDIGCPNIDTIQNINDWLVWMDNEGRIHARNDATGQYEIISRAIRNRWLEKLTATNIAAASSGKSKNVYKIEVGQVNGEYWRFCYDFDANNWTREIHTRDMLQHINSDMSGVTRLYFMDAGGQLFLDEQGDLDDTATIPFYVRFGRDNSQMEQMKAYIGLYVIARNSAGATVKMSFDGSDMQDIGGLEGRFTRIAIPDKINAKGRDYDLEITQNAEGLGISIEALITFYNVEESNFG